MLHLLFPLLLTKITAEVNDGGTVLGIGIVIVLKISIFITSMFWNDDRENSVWVSIYHRDQVHNAFALYMKYVLFSSLLRYRMRPSYLLLVPQNCCGCLGGASVALRFFFQFLSLLVVFYLCCCIALFCLSHLRRGHDTFFFFFVRQVLFFSFL